MIQTFSNARASTNNCLVLDEDRLHVSKVPVRDLPEPVELRDDVPGVVLDNATAHVPLAGVVAVKLGLKSNQLTIEYLAAPNYSLESSEVTLASKDDATLAFTALQSRLEGFKMGVEEENAAEPMRWLVVTTIGTVILASVALGLDQVSEELVNPIRAGFGFAFGSCLTLRLSFGRSPEFRGLLTLITIVVGAMTVATLLGSTLTLILGLASVVSCFCWLGMRLLQVEQVAVLRKQFVSVEEMRTSYMAPLPAPDVDGQTEYMAPPEGLTEVDGFSPDTSSESPPPPQS